MATSVDHVLEHILEGKIDKQSALRSFNELSHEEQSRVLSRLRSRLDGESSGDAAEASAESIESAEASESTPAPRLESLHELKLEDHHAQYIAELSKIYEERVPKSKDNALKHQAYFVDQRKTAGLKKSLKSLQFQLTYDRADGAYIYDIDGNKYVDIAGDNGVNLFGHQAPFLQDALTERMKRGNPLVAYSEELFETARLFTELTGHERMVFAQSGTEAVMWAVRIARAATGRKKVVIFDGSYHGLSDAVLAFRDRNGNPMSAGLGMLQEFADQLIILDYGDMEGLQVIERRADEIACVLTEPVQSRFPARQPTEFLKELRKLTLEHGNVLIFDEMITGFRAGPRGAEGYFQVKPDIATYGKVAGGGMPTGVIAGLAKYMDYVDGGSWRFDDNSMPSLRRTMMAGTHTQNSLKVASALAVCREMKRMCQVGPGCDYQSCTCELSEINRRTEMLARELNAFFEAKRVPLVIECFSSLFRFQVIDDPFGMVRELLVVLLKINGVETSASGNCFLTTAHTDDDVRTVVDATIDGVETLLEKGFFVEPAPEPEPSARPEPADGPTDSAASGRGESVESLDDSAAQRLKELILADLQQNVLGENA